MEDNVFLFTAKIYKYGTEEILEECQVLAYNLFQANHILTDYVQTSNRFKMPLEVGSIERLRYVNNIINPEFVIDMMDDDSEYDGSIPLQVANSMSDEDTILFECYCKTKLRIPANMEFPYVTCPNPACDNHIKRSELKLFGTHWIYEKDENEK